jgi:hypothetical protein
MQPTKAKKKLLGKRMPTGTAQKTNQLTVKDIRIGS